MRFISQSRRFGVQARASKTVVENGMEREVTSPLYCQFWQDDIREHEIEIAEKSFNFHGRTTELDTVTPTPILNRLSVFDTVLAQQHEGWTDEEREYVERRLLERAEQTGNINFMHVAEPEIPPPWPNYNQFRGTIPRLIERIREDGYDFNQVLTYEQSQFGLRRPEVLAALRAEVEGSPRPFGETEDPSQYVTA